MRVLVATVSFVSVALFAAGCGRSGDLVASSSGAPGDDLAGGGPVVDMAGGTCGPNGRCPPPLQCHDGMCCAGMVCMPPPMQCDKRHPCPPGEQCIMGTCWPTLDAGHRHDMSHVHDGGTVADLSVGSDGGTTTDGGTSDGGNSGDGGMSGGCTNDNQCPGARCDWLTGMCVPIESCNRDRDCPFGSACVGHQCLPIQICLPIGGFPPCPPGEHCAFPPGVCVPNPNCGPNIGPCPVGDRCVGGYCQPDACMSAADCNDGYDCVKGVCVPRRYCGPFEPCPRGLRCRAHICGP
jgi:hypothetical protein